MKNKSGISNYMFLLPAFLIYVSVIVVPAIYSLYISFFKWNGIGEKKFIGLKNYIDLFTNDKIFYISIKNNVIWMFLTLVFTVAVALALALLLNQKFRGRAFFRSYFYFPFTLSMILVAIVFRRIYDPSTGFINEFLRAINLDSLTSTWTADPKIALYCIFAAALWRGIGQPMILFLSGLQTVPIELWEAAKIDGANKFQTFINVTIPMMRETFIIVIATQIMASMKVFDYIKGMTGGGPANSTQTLATYMYQQTFYYANFGKGTAIAIVMLLLMMAIIIPYILYNAKKE